MSGEAGRRLVAERIARLPDALRRFGAERNPPLPLGERPIRRFVTTGIGSSRAHARFLAERLSTDLGVRADSVPLSSLASPSPFAESEVLIVFSQGMSPSVRPLASAAKRWARLVFVTAAREGDDRREPVRSALREGGSIVRSIPAADEFGALVRVVGPMLGYLECLRVVSAVARSLGMAIPRPEDVPSLADTVAASAARFDEAFGTVADMADLGDAIAFVALGRYGDLALNLQYKVLEGMLRPWPPVWDLLEFAHGPFQELHGRRATLFALTHRGDDGEARLVARLRTMLVPERHRLVVLESALASSLAIFEHEALINQLMLRFMSAAEIDPAHWPGRGLDAPLYEADDWLAPEAGPSSDAAEMLAVSPVTLAKLTRPEVERALAAGRTTAIVPLGSTEQHGGHLPLGADTAIADALAHRLSADVADAIVLPTVALGCSSEHLGFAGTLTIGEVTFAAVLGDLVASLASSGFRRAFLFSAHGGNFAPLARALPGLRRLASPFGIDAFTDLAALTEALQSEALAHGISGEAAGHHAGETETSIMLALDPTSVRVAEMLVGTVEPTSDPQSLFYPRLKLRAPGGVVGDPRTADAARGERYLETWVRLLTEAYFDEKNHK